MKNPILYIALILVLPLFVLSCDENNNSINATALTENDFAEDGALRADLERVVVTFLESPNSEETENDTGTLGVDVIPVTYDDTVEQTFCWEDDDGEAMHFMELRDSEGSLVITVEANGDCVTEIIDAGNYVTSIHHDGRLENTNTIFVIPDTNDTQQVRKSHWLFNKFKHTVANILVDLKSTLYDDAIAQVQENIDTLIKTKNCQGCDLIGANMSGADLQDTDLTGAIVPEADLSGANLSGANLQQAILNKTNLSGADLQQANLSDADLTQADLTQADLTQADLTRASLFRARAQDVVMFRANLTQADLSRADLTRATLNRANLSGAELSRTILVGATLGRATWINGSCICAPTSVGRCVACQ